MLRPMLASLADAPLVDPQLAYEPKYDGIRAICEVEPRGAVRLWSRLGNDKTSQFPEVADALRRWAARRTSPVVLDGEIVALDAAGTPTGFQQLQGRIHLTAATSSAPHARRAPSDPGRTSVALIVFDVLREGSTDLRDRPLLARRAVLEKLFPPAAASRAPGTIRISEMVRGDGTALYERALASGWEGLIAKQIDSPYRSGKRSPEWRKLKIVHEQEFVIGGWTEPRETRSYFGALLLGVYEPSTAPSKSSTSRKTRTPAAAGARELTYVGHTGTGFDERELARLMRLLAPLEIRESPFSIRPKTNERPHWVRPSLVAQIKFTEWTTDDKLRHPVYLGLRDDKKPEDVIREPTVRLHVTSSSRLQTTKKTAVKARASRAGEPPALSAEDSRRLIDELKELERAKRDGVLALPGGGEVKISNLHKPFWPALKLTKGDLFRYYVQVAPFLLPVIADRPLVMKRFPNGIAGPPFYQHRATDAPAGVRVETVAAAESRPQIVGGTLATLLYTTQLAAISQDPWFSRVQSPEFADHVALDLDPADGVPFARVLDVARWIRDELASLGVTGCPKTSGADGLHIYVPLPPKTPYEAGLLFCQIVATVVAHKHPQVATVERSVKARGRRVYVDYLQNILGKTLASAYSARASEYAGVSTPLTWQEVDTGVRREDFTIRTVPARLEAVGDLWAALRSAKPVDLSRVQQYAEREGASEDDGEGRVDAKPPRRRSPRKASRR